MLNAVVAADVSLKQLIKDVRVNAFKQGNKDLKVIIEQLLHFKKAFKFNLNFFFILSI